MEFREFKYIKTIAELGSFTKAAQVLYTSQPSLSHLVARIEGELGVALFDRNVKPMRLTYAGEVYLRHAQDILNSTDQMLREFENIANGQRNQLTIGLPYERASYMLPQLITMLRQEFPGMELNVKTGRAPKLTEMLQKGEIEFAVMPILGLAPGLESTLIYEEELCLVAGPNIISPADCCKEDPNMISIEKLRGKPFVIQRTGHIIRKAIDGLLEDAGITPNIVLEVDGNAAAYRVSTGGLGVSVVPRMTSQIILAPWSHYCYRLSNGHPVTWEIHAVYRKGAYLGKLERRCFEIIREAQLEENYN